MQLKSSNFLHKKTLRSLLLISLLLITIPANSNESTFDEISLTESDISGDKVRVYLIPKNQATISSEVSGKIVSLPFVMGERFNKGDLLVELDTELAQAAKDKATIEHEASKINLEAVSDLRSRDDATLVELINAKRDEAVTKAGLILAKKNLEMCKILAPYSGRVVKLNSNEHELAASGEPLLNIIDDNTLLAHFLLPISDFPSTKIGTELVIMIPIINKELTARISQISATLDAASGTFEVAADIDNSAHLLRAGMSGWFTPHHTKNN